MAFLRKLWRGRKPAQAGPAPSPVGRKESVGWQVEVGWATDVGRQRQHNEDTVLVLEANQGGDNPMPPFGLFVLADGMGGHRAGEVASGLAARTVAGYVVQHVYLSALSRREHGAGEPSLKEVLVEAVNLANTAVAAEVPGGGTTLICAMVLGTRAYIANVGDSRAYLVLPEGLERITRDHSLVDRLVELGQLTTTEAANHPQKNVLYRAVGQGGVLEVDVFVRSIPPGGRLLLCTDGLWGMVPEEEMAHLIARARSLQAACDALVIAANEAGGKDNISVILVEPPGA